MPLISYVHLCPAHVVAFKLNESLPVSFCTRTPVAPSGTVSCASFTGRGPPLTLGLQKSRFTSAIFEREAPLVESVRCHLHVCGVGEQFAHGSVGGSVRPESICGEDDTVVRRVYGISELAREIPLCTKLIGYSFDTLREGTVSARPLCWKPGELTIDIM